MTPASSNDWPAVALRMWRSRTGLSNVKIATLLGHGGYTITPAGVQAWVSGEVHVPARVVPLLQAIDHAAASMWDQAQRTARGEEEPAAEDVLPLGRRCLRLAKEAGEVVAEIASALDDGDGIDAPEARRILAQLAAVQAEIDRARPALDAVVTAARSSR